MLRVRVLHERGASSGNQSLTSVLDKLATSAMLNQGSSAGSSDRGALLMAVNMDSTDWQRRIDSKILERVLSHVSNSNRKKMKNNVNGDHLNNKKPANNIGSSATITSAATVHTEAIGVKPYGTTLPICCDSVETPTNTPPNEKEMIAMIDVLVEARNFGESTDSLPDGLLGENKFQTHVESRKEGFVGGVFDAFVPQVGVSRARGLFWLQKNCDQQMMMMMMMITVVCACLSLWIEVQLYLIYIYIMYRARLSKNQLSLVLIIFSFLLLYILCYCCISC